MRSNLLKSILLGSLLAASCGLQPGDTLMNGRFGYATTAHYMAYSTQADEVAFARVTASSERNSYFPVTKVNDGNLSTAWGPSESDPAPTLTFDFNRSQPLSGLGIKKSPDGITVDVEVSDNGTDWEVIEEGLSPKTATMDWIDLPYVQAAHVRLRFHGATSQLLVCEVKFYGDYNQQPEASPTPWPTSNPSYPPLEYTPTPSPTTTPSPIVTPTPTGSTVPTPQPTSSPQPTPRPTPTPPPHNEDCGCDVTGGGWILNGNQKVTFGFVAHHNPALGPSGNIQVVDHATKTRFHGQVTSVECAGTTATFSGTLRTGGTFTVTVTDNGEPGRNDRFSFSTSAGVDLSGELGGSRSGGGNIQLHKRHCD